MCIRDRCSSYTDINPEFGTVSDFKSLVEKAHQLGMKVIIDWVANHTGWGHEWTKPHPDWYMKDAKGNFTEENGWYDVIDLNYDVKDMRLAMIDAMKYWISKFDIDGFRCDMAHLVPLDFWKEARPACETLKPLFWLAECEEISYHDIFDVSYAWSWMHQTERFMRGEAPMNAIIDTLHQYAQYPQDSQKLFFTANHDENTWNGTEYEKYGDAAKAFAVFTCTWLGMPLIYSGQELPNYKRLQFFDKDLIEWSDNIQLHDFYKTLLNLHKSKAIGAGETFILPTNSNGLIAFLRKQDSEVVLVILNLLKEDRIHITIEHDWLKGKFVSVFSQLQYQFNSKEVFELQANDYLVYKTL